MTIVMGGCNHCGRCCRPPTMRHPEFVIDYTKKIGTTIQDGECRYLTEPLEDGRQLCRIRIAVEKGDTTEFPKEHVAYWKRCCRDWPTYKCAVTEAALKDWAARGYLDGCGFVLMEDGDG